MGVLILFGMLYMPAKRTNNNFADPGERSVFRPQQQDDNVSRDDPNVNFVWMKPISASTEPYT